MIKRSGKKEAEDSGKKKTSKAASTSTPKSASNESGEVYAAIAMALYAYQDDTHDVESNVLTFKNAYGSSPWGFKAFGMRQTPEVKKAQTIKK